MESRFLSNMAGQKDLMLVLAISLVLLMMILPLPQVLMDILITINMSVSILILLVSIHLKSPVHFSTFPSMLLITTLFRLAISVSTTRLILIDGDAGQIVETFGQVVVSGNLVVGLVIFLIITVVQFMVITKGADRVAEVSARFTLDGLPGKQMSVDADVRAGVLDQVDAQQRRNDLQKETQLFGAMDGAMKFVKGDSIAGLIITAINIIGGIAIGMAQNGLPFSQALELYSLLTIGDGLVSQIPALLISIASGTIVTRVTNKEGDDLGSDILNQLTANSRTIFIAGIVITLFGLIPGFPTHIFFLLGGGLSAGMYFAARKQRKALAKWKSDWALFCREHETRCAEARRRTEADPSLEIQLPAAVKDFDPSRFATLFDLTRQEFQEEYGVAEGYWRFRIADVDPLNYRILIGGQLVASGPFDPELLFVKAAKPFMDALGIECASLFDDNGACMVHVSQRDKLLEANVPSEDAIGRLFHHVKAEAVAHLPDFFGIRQTKQLLDSVMKTNPTLVEDLKSALSINQVSTILKRLTAERVAATNIVGILEAILEWAPKDPNPLLVVEKVRAAIGEHIVRKFAPSDFLPVAIVAPSLEASLRDGLRTVQHESFLVLEASYSEEVARQVRRFMTSPFKVERDPVLITQSDVRRHLHCMLEERCVYVPVVSYQEVPPTVTIYPVDFIQVEDGS